MVKNDEIATPHNVFPRDVTSPGPDQRPGVARSQQTKKKLEEQKKLPQPEKDEKPAKQADTEA